MEEQKRLLELINKQSSVNDVQEYIKKVITLRGFTNQSIQDKMLLLLEEIKCYYCLKKLVSLQKL